MPSCPTEGRARGVQVCGAAEGGAGDAALSLRGSGRVKTPAGPMRWPCSVLRGIEEGGPSRAVPGRQSALHSGSMAILVHLVQSHQRGHAAAQGFVPPAVDRRPTRKGRRLKGKSTGGRTEQASNTARGTPGNRRTSQRLGGAGLQRRRPAPAPRGTGACGSGRQRSEASACYRDPGVPRALDLSRRCEGRRKTKGAPGASQTIRAMTHVCLIFE
jgi:hypothetical protein